MGLANSFINQHRPYLNRYIEQYTAKKGELFNSSDWRTVQGFLSYSLIARAIKGAITLGYYSSTITQAIGVDIDDHKGYGKAYLLDIYNQVVEKMGFYPSILVKTPRGLHAYWYLTQPYSTNIIKEYTKEKLNDLLRIIELRPDTLNAIRMPRENALIDPETLEPINRPFDEVIELSEKYDAIDLFLQEWEPQQPTLSNSPKAKKLRLNMLKNGDKITDIELKIAPYGFVNGQTNDQFLKLIAMYRRYGLDANATYERFLMLLNRSHLYTGDIAKTLAKRIKSAYKRKDYKPRLRPIQPTLFDQETVDYAVKNSPFATQRNEPIRRFVKELLKWKNYHDQIAKDPIAMQELNYYYKYYYKNRKEGYYPLPRNLLNKWNKRYNELLPFLIELEILEPSPYGYWADKTGANSVVKYYSINTITTDNPIKNEEAYIGEGGL